MKLADFIHPGRFAALAEEEEEEGCGAATQAATVAASPDRDDVAAAHRSTTARAATEAYAAAAPPGTTPYVKEADDSGDFAQQPYCRACVWHIMRIVCRNTCNVQVHKEIGLPPLPSTAPAVCCHVTCGCLWRFLGRLTST